MPKRSRSEAIQKSGRSVIHTYTTHYKFQSIPIHQPQKPIFIQIQPIIHDYTQTFQPPFVLGARRTHTT